MINLRSMTENRRKITKNRLENSKENDDFVGDDHQIEKNACGGSNEITDECKDVPFLGKSEEKISDKTDENSDSTIEERNVCRKSRKMDITSLVNIDDLKNTPFSGQNEEKVAEKSGKISESEMAQTDTKQCSKSVQNECNCEENGKSEIGGILLRKFGNVERCTPRPLSQSPVNVDQLVIQAIKKLNCKSGSTFGEIKKYIASNCDVNINRISEDIKRCLRGAVANEVLIKKDHFRYSLPLPKERPKRRLSQRRVHGRPKRRKKKVPSEAAKSPKQLQEKDGKDDE